MTFITWTFHQKNTSQKYRCSKSPTREPFELCSPIHVKSYYEPFRPCGLFVCRFDVTLTNKVPKICVVLVMCRCCSHGCHSPAWGAIALVFPVTLLFVSLDSSTERWQSHHSLGFCELTYPEARTCRLR